MNSISKTLVIGVGAGSLLLGACATYDTRVDNIAGKPTVYEDVRSSGSVQGVGIESQDIVGMTDKMMRDMLANPVLSGRPTPPRVIVDSQNFVNESSSRINKNIITDRLAVELNRAANGRLVFVDRESIGVVEAERDLARSGVVDGGTIRRTQATAKADFKLVGRMTSQDAIDPATGKTSRYQYIAFKMLDLELGTVPWTGSYEFQKASQNDVIYR